MMKRFLILVETCFLLLFSFAAHADVIADPEVIIEETWWPEHWWSQLLVIVLIGALVIGTVALIRKLRKK